MKDTKKEEAIWDVMDNYGAILPRHYSGRARTKKEADALIKRLNKNGEYAPYHAIKNLRKL